jgi:hypothetical protein
MNDTTIVITDTAAVERLAVLEITIQAGMASFIDVGRALAEIRESRLYRASFSTFEDYCIAKWHLSSSRARQLIASVEVAQSVTNVTLSNEGQARELAKVPPDRREDVMRRAGEKPTARSIREAALTEAKPQFEIHPDAVAAGEEAAKDSEKLWQQKSMWKKTCKRDRVAFIEWIQHTITPTTVQRQTERPDPQADDGWDPNTELDKILGYIVEATFADRIEAVIRIFMDAIARLEARKTKAKKEGAR